MSGILAQAQPRRPNCQQRPHTPLSSEYIPAKTGRKAACAASRSELAAGADQLEPYDTERKLVGFNLHELKCDFYQTRSPRQMPAGCDRQSWKCCARIRRGAWGGATLVHVPSLAGKLVRGTTPDTAGRSRTAWPFRACRGAGPSSDIRRRSSRRPSRRDIRT